MFDIMILNMKVDNDELKEKYTTTYTNVSGDAGIDLFVPETITIPAKQLGFKIDHLYFL